MSSEIVLAFETSGDWAATLAVFIFVLGNWVGGNIGAAPAALRQRFAATEVNMANGGWGLLALSAGFVAAIVYLVGILLFVSWLIYIIQGPAADPNDWYYILVNALVFFAVIFSKLGDWNFYAAGAFGVAIALRLLAMLLFLGALISAIIETVQISGGTDETGSNIFLSIVLGLIVLVELFWLVRSWGFFSFGAPFVGAEGEALLSGTNAARAVQGAFKSK